MYFWRTSFLVNHSTHGTDRTIRNTPDASRENGVVKTQELIALVLIFLHATAFWFFSDMERHGTLPFPDIGLFFGK